MSEQRTHPDGFCRVCCLLCGWCSSDEPHECFGVGRPMGIVSRRQFVLPRWLRLWSWGRHAIDVYRSRRMVRR